jgi:MFS-type transporter involved in bile tolerance (Atg22 family)
MRIGLPRVVVVLGVVSLLTDVSSEMILPLLPSLLLGTMGATPILVGLVDGFADALSAVLKLVTGNLSDRTSRRKPFVLAGYTLSTIVRPLISIAIAPWHVVGVRAVDRVGKGLRSAPRDALIADAVPREDAPRAYAFHRMMDHTGAILGPLVAAALLAMGLSAREAIAAAWVPGAMAVIALFFLREAPRPPPARRAPGQRAPLPPSLRRLLAVVGLFSLGVLGDSFLLVRARDLGVAEPLLPILWSVLHLAKVAAASGVARLNAATKRTLVAAWLVVAAGIALLLVGEALVVWPAAVILGLGHGAREPVEKALVRAIAPEAAHGRAFGAYHLVTGLGALPAGLGVGFLWLHGGGQLALAASAGVVLAAGLALALFSRAAAGTSPSTPP